jgi:hypothetical protein
MNKWMYILVFLIISIGANSTENDIIPVTNKVDKINITVDARIEALAVVQYLNKYFLISQYDFEYKELIDTHFSKYKEHKAIGLFSKLKDHGFKFSLPPETMLYLNNDFTLNESFDLADSNLPKDFPLNDLYLFFDELRSFVKESDFKVFFDANRGFYQKLTIDVAKTLKGESDLMSLEQFYGKSNESYNIVLSPLFHHGGFGPQTKGSVGYNLFSIIGPVGSMNNRPSFGNKDRLSELVNHEFSHSFIANIFKQYSKEIGQYEQLLIPIKEDMAKQGYKTWEIALNEHVVRAVTTTISYQKNNKLGDENLKSQKDNYFIYIDSILDSFKKYESQRHKYQTFDSYFPILLSHLPLNKV